jgi:hypothetical protein
MGLTRDLCALPQKINSIQAFNELLYTNKKSGCSIITWNILGLPVSAFNAVFSFSVFLIAIYCGKEKERPVKTLDDLWQVKIIGL